ALGAMGRLPGRQGQDVVLERFLKHWLRAEFEQVRRRLVGLALGGQPQQVIRSDRRAPLPFLVEQLDRAVLDVVDRDLFRLGEEKVIHDRAGEDRQRLLYWLLLGAD